MYLNYTTKNLVESGMELEESVIVNSIFTYVCGRSIWEKVSGALLKTTKLYYSS